MADHVKTHTKHVIPAQSTVNAFQKKYCCSSSLCFFSLPASLCIFQLVPCRHLLVIAQATAKPVVFNKTKRHRITIQGFPPPSFPLCFLDWRTMEGIHKNSLHVSFWLTVIVRSVASVLYKVLGD